MAKKRAATKAATVVGSWAHPQDEPVRRFLLSNRAALGSITVFAVMLAIFIVANPAVFTSWTLYNPVLTTLPVAIFMTVPLVFIVTVGEIDLSFPATMGLAAWMFALVVQAGYDPFLGIAAAIVTGALLGGFVGGLVVYANRAVAYCNARHELRAARYHSHFHRRQIDFADSVKRKLGLHDLLV